MSALNIEATPLPFECTLRVLEHLRQAGADKEWDARIPVSKDPALLSKSLRDTVFNGLAQVGPKIVLLDSTDFPYSYLVPLMDANLPSESCVKVPTDGIEAWLVFSADYDSIERLLLALRRCQIKLSIISLVIGECIMVRDYGDFVGIGRIANLDVMALYKHLA